MRPHALGVDIGGTKIAVTLGNSRGRILAKQILPTRVGKAAKRALHELTEVLKKLKDRKPAGGKILGIGVGVPGPMNPDTGIVQRSPHLGGWKGIPLKSFLEKKLRLPVYMANDANAAALGEKIFGAGRGHRICDLIYLTVSTGIGSGLISGGRLLHGVSYGAGEVGHTIIVPDGERCGCGHRGCLEAYASGTAIARFVQNELRKGRRSKVGRLVRTGQRVNAEVVALAASEKDALALEAYRRAGYYLGVGLANLINLLNPAVISLGGSVMKSSRFFWPAMVRAVRQNAWPFLYKDCRIVKTQLGDRVGDLGALALVFAGGWI